MCRFRMGAWRSRSLLLFAWLGVVAAAGALGAVRSPGVWLAAAAGVAAAAGSLVTTRVGTTLDSVSGPSSPSVPERLFQLPPDVGDFTGRREVSRQLRALLLSPAASAGSAVMISAVSGQGGVGKTALAIHLGHELTPQFPDGQMYVNLRGVEREHADPGLVLADFLRDLGVDSAAIPDGLEARSRLYRSRLAGRRVLIVLDNALNEEQVRPLLPGRRSCAVIITSRARLVGLEAATTCVVDVLPVSDAVELLARIAGAARVTAQPQEARAIAEACCCLPLAVRVAGARLAARPDWPLGEMVKRLRGTRSPLDELRAGDLDVRASLALGYAGMPAEAQRAFRLLGLLRAADFAAWPLAAVLDVPLRHAGRLAETLADAQLLQAQGLDAAGQARYRFHDLVRDFARECGQKEERPRSRNSAVQRFLGACLYLTDHAEPLLEPGGFTHAPGSKRWPGQSDPDLLAALQSDPAGWYAAERSTLVTAVAQAHDAQFSDVTWELADNLCAYLDVGSLWDDWAAVHELGLDSARRSRNTYGEAVIRRNIGILERMRGCVEEAQANFGHALGVFDGIGDGPQIADTLGNLSDVYLDVHDYPAAMSCLNRSLMLFEQHHIRRGQAWAYQMLGAIAQLEGRPQDAHPLLDSAETLFREIGDIRGLGWAIRCRGDAHRDLANTMRATDAYQTALALLGKTGDLRGIALVRIGKARLHDRERDTQNAVSEYEQALSIFCDIGDIRSEGETLLALGQLHTNTRKHKNAQVSYQKSLAAYSSINDQYGINEATRRLDRLNVHHYHRRWKVKNSF